MINYILLYIYKYTLEVITLEDIPTIGIWHISLNNPWPLAPWPYTSWGTWATDERLERGAATSTVSSWRRQELKETFGEGRRDEGLGSGRSLVRSFTRKKWWTMGRRNFGGTFYGKLHENGTVFGVIHRIDLRNKMRIFGYCGMQWSKSSCLGQISVFFLKWATSDSCKHWSFLEKKSKNFCGTPISRTTQLWLW